MRHSGFTKQKSILIRCNFEPGNVSNAEPNDSKEELAARLEKAEAEAKALRRELEIRKKTNNLDLSKLTPTSFNRVDGTGFRETLFQGPGGKGEKKGKDKWGISEAEIFFSKGAPGEGSGFSGMVPAMEEGAEDTVKRRLVIGLTLSAVTVALSLTKLPTLLSKPSKPLFFYVVPLLELQEGLQTMTSNESIDITGLTVQLRKLLREPGSVKDYLLSASALLEGSQSDQGTKLAFEILEYLDQADYQKYFESRGVLTPTQKMEFLKFSLQSVQSAKLKLTEFLKMIPNDDKEAAKLQLSRQYSF